jgi:hypothetical protein
MRRLSIVGLVVLLGFNYPALRSWLLINYFNGVELSDKGRSDKPIYRLVKSCHMNASVHADKPWNFELMFDTKVIWLPNRILFNTGRQNERFELEIESLPMRADVVIVEDRTSEIVKFINRLDVFNKIYDEEDGVIWLNTKSKNSICI